MRERCGAVPDVVLFWEAYDLVTSAFLQLFNANFRVVIFCEDLHWFHAGDAGHENACTDRGRHDTCVVRPGVRTVLSGRSRR